MMRGFAMNKFDPKIHDDNSPLDAAFMAGMKPSFPPSRMRGIYD
jgi:hypothetical protein